ncbi:MAG: hypothetical protein ACFE0R_04835, partial [Salinarimonas sp.]
MNDLVRPTDLIAHRPLREGGDVACDPGRERGVPASGTSHTPERAVQTIAIGRRRALVAGLTLAGFLALMIPAVAILGSDGLGPLDLVVLVAFALSAPWTVLGLVNAGIGFAIARLARDPCAAVAPFVPAGDRATPTRSRVAVFMTLGNEAAARAIR